MRNELTLSCRAEGYAKSRGQVDPEHYEMGIEAQPELRVSASGIDQRINLRVFVAPQPGDRPNIDMQESAVKLTIADARSLADWLHAETDRLSGRLYQEPQH